MSPIHRFTDKNRQVLTLKWGDEKKIATQLINKKLPSDCCDDVYIRYVKKWNSHAYKGRYTAMRWLQSEIARLTSALQFFPVSLYKLKTIKLRKAQAKLCADMCQSILVDCTSSKAVGLFETEKQMLDYANFWHFTPTPPTARLIQETTETDGEFKVREKELLAMGRIERLRTDKWWEAKIERAYAQFSEHCRIISGKTRLGISKYVSETARKNFISRKKAGEHYIERMVARNTETGEEIPMRGIVDGSIANPEIRRTELMVRMRGFEDIADENKLVGGFFTITSPSKFHAFSTVERKGKRSSVSNAKYQGANPAQTQHYLCKTWSKARAKLKRLGIPVMGFRVAEPHHDATPHWHALFFFEEKHEASIVSIMKDYFTAEERDELSTEALMERRFKYIRIDKSRGSATGYIAKYIAKNIDGYKLDDSEKGEALSACAWASLWGIRQFQQIGGAPVGVWRELRRLPSTNIKIDEEETESLPKEAEKTAVIKSFLDLKQEKHPLELARYSADIGNWSMYLLAMGGIFCPRSLAPVSLTYKQVENGYGETVTRTNGVICLGVEKVTREGAWQITRKTNDARDDGVCKRQLVPWSSVNNCTGGDKSDVERAVIDQARQLGVGIDAFETDILTAGGSLILSDRIVGDERRIERMKLSKTWLDNGGDELKISNEIQKRKQMNSPN